MKNQGARGGIRMGLLGIAFLWSWTMANAQTFMVVSIHGEIKRGGVLLKLDDEITLDNNKLPEDVIIDENAHAALFHPTHGKRVLKKGGVEVIPGASASGQSRSKIVLNPWAIATSKTTGVKFYCFDDAMFPTYYAFKNGEFHLWENSNDKLVLLFKWNKKQYKTGIKVNYERAEQDTAPLANFHVDSLFFANGKYRPMDEVKDVKIIYYSPGLYGKKYRGPYPFRFVFLDRDSAFLHEIKCFVKAFSKDPAQLSSKISEHLCKYYGICRQDESKILAWLTQRQLLP